MEPEINREKYPNGFTIDEAIRRLDEISKLMDDPQYQSQWIMGELLYRAGLITKNCFSSHEEPIPKLVSRCTTLGTIAIIADQEYRIARLENC